MGGVCAMTVICLTPPIIPVSVKIIILGVKLGGATTNTIPITTNSTIMILPPKL